MHLVDEIEGRDSEKDVRNEVYLSGARNSAGICIGIEASTNDRRVANASWLLCVCVCVCVCSASACSKINH